MNRQDGPLTEREKSVLEALTRLGKPKLVAEELGISYRSVIQGLFLARRKLEANSNVTAVLGYRNGGCLDRVDP